MICVIVIASFVFFAADQTRTASGRQTERLGAGEGVAVAAVPPRAAAAKAPSKSPVRRTIDEASQGLTSPFSGLLSSVSSEWAMHGLKLALALLVYGFGLGYVARVLRVRV